MTRVVVDTNVLISAAIKRDGLEARVLAMCFSRALENALSDALEAEFRSVGSRKKFARHAETLAALTDALVQASSRVTVSDPPRRCTDPDDDMVLACAEAARARYLVTGNTSDFPADTGLVRVLNARALLVALGEIEPGSAKAT